MTRQGRSLLLSLPKPVQEGGWGVAKLDRADEVLDLVRDSGERRVELSGGLSRDDVVIDEELVLKGGVVAERDYSDAPA